MTLVMLAKIIHPIPCSGEGPIEGCEDFFSEKNELFRRFWHLAQAVLMGDLFVDNANGEKIQIGEQLDWRVSLTGPGGTG